MINCAFSCCHVMTLLDSSFLKKCLDFLERQKIVCIFAATIPTTPLNDAYHGGTSFFMTST